MPWCVRLVAVAGVASAPRYRILAVPGASINGVTVFDAGAELNIDRFFVFGDDAADDTLGFTNMAVKLGTGGTQTTVTYGGEWALYNNRTWESDSYNDWWHDQPWRSYPKWVSTNQNCERMWWSGGGWRC